MQDSMISKVANAGKEQPIEGELTKKVEKITAQVPSMAYLGLAAGSLAFAVTLALMRERKGWANFVGLWVPSFLILGLYNKIVKTEGSDKRDSLH